MAWLDRRRFECNELHMTLSIVAHSDSRDSREAGASLGDQVAKALKGEPPDALILFASPQHDLPALLAALDASCHPHVLVGSTSAGEFTSRGHGDGMACAVALRSPEMSFTATVARGLSEGRKRAAHELTSGFQGRANPAFAHRTCLVLADALAGHTDDLVSDLAEVTGGAYQFFGGGAGGDDRFQHRAVFYGTEIIPDAAVALEILSNKPIGIGVRHGWQPASPPLRVTDAEGMTVASLNAAPAVEVFEDHAQRTQQRFDRQDPFPFFLHNIVGIVAEGGHKLRVPLAVNSDGSVACATEVPKGSTVHLMSVTTASAVEAAAASARDAIGQLEGHKPSVALVFDCVATRLRMGKELGFELDAVQRELGPARFAGCNTIGQIASAPGQFSGFHNCTAVVCVIPE